MILRFSFVVLLHIAAIVLFASGFLLSRTALTDRSDCSQWTAVSDRDSLDASARQCQPKPAFKRLVLIVVDAWRYDFARTIPKQDGTGSSFYAGKMERLQDLIRSHPLGTFLARFRADPPTTTLQRLKALTTGSLPTFVEAGSNFGGSEIEEDNLVYQLVSRSGKKLAFVGDDTWMGLFPKELAASPNSSFPYPSLNVWDLDTVDKGCVRHLFPTLRGERGHWDIAVAHFLGVDHAGHRYGPGHPEMERKLRETDAVIGDVAELLGQDDLLVVLGDHGMDAKGDHGGDSSLEVDAALFAFSPRGFVSSRTELLELERFAELLRTRKLDGNGADDSYGPLCAGHCRTVSQIDLVPTLALLMGIPIPFQNLGSMVPELVWAAAQDFPRLAKAQRMNAKQMLAYLERYAEVSPRDLPPSRMSELRTLFQKAEREGSATSSEAEETILAYTAFQRASLQSLRQIWAQFDVSLMALGSVVLFSAILAAASVSVLDAVIAMYSTWRGAVIGFLLLRGAVGVARLLGLRSVGGLTTVVQLVGGASAGAGLSLAISALFSWIASRSKKSNRTGSALFSTVFPGIAVVFAALQAFGMGSVKFVLWEDFYVAILAATILVFLGAGLSLARPRSQKLIMGTFLPAILAVVASSYSTICREEQLPSCVPTFYSSPSSSVPSYRALTAMTFAGLFAVLLLSRAASIGASRRLYGGPRLIVALLYPLLILISLVYWWIDYYLQGGGKGFWGMSVSALETTKTVVLVRYLWIPLMVTSHVAWWSSPISLDARETASADGGRPWQVVGGSSSVRAGSLSALAVLHATLSLVQKGLGSAGFHAFFSIMLLLSLIPVSNAGVASALAILAHHFFFRTGHQAVLATLDWTLGFVGLSHVHYVASPTMVMANFVAAFLLAGASVPLLRVASSASVDPETGNGSGDNRRRDILRAAMIFSSLIAFTLFFCMVSCIILRRHLMVWKVFAPRFMLGCVALGAADLGCLLGLASAERLLRVSDFLGEASKRFKLQ